MAEQEKVFTSLEDPEWYNKTRVLLVSSRGLTAAQRQFVLTIFSLLPHSKKDFNLEKEDVHEQIQQLCDTHKTRYFLYFQSKKKVKFCLWLGRYPQGPSIKFDIDGILHTRDVKFQGNSVKGARHILSFDEEMDIDPKLRVAKELLIGAFNIPKYHPKSTAVIDHTLNFIGKGDDISFRNYQIYRQSAGKQKEKVQLFEIGPRFILKTECILDGVICGQVLYRSPIIKKFVKKGKMDKRKGRKVEQVEDRNIFGQQN